jgi:hypothetical protein
MFHYIFVDHNLSRTLEAKKQDTLCSTPKWILTALTCSRDKNVDHGEQDPKVIISGFLPIYASMTGLIILFLLRTFVLKDLHKRYHKAPSMVSSIFTAHEKETVHRSLEHTTTSFRRSVCRCIVATSSLSLTMYL